MKYAYLSVCFEHEVTCKDAMTNARKWEDEKYVVIQLQIHVGVKRKIVLI